MCMTRGLLVTCVYRKLFVLRASDDLSGAMTLMSTDVERIGTGLQEIHDVWASLIGTAVGCAVLALFGEQHYLESLMPSTYPQSQLVSVLSYLWPW